ncbi:MAG TPA: hypothetical protein VMR41_05005 [Patescibacteria group bacterium]|nr:hypothetical protein [Patescibacteria group bacterium]
MAENNVDGQEGTKFKYKIVPPSEEPTDNTSPITVETVNKLDITNLKSLFLTRNALANPDVVNRIETKLLGYYGLVPPNLAERPQFLTDIENILGLEKDFGVDGKKLIKEYREISWKEFAEFVDPSQKDSAKLSLREFAEACKTGAIYLITSEQVSETADRALESSMLELARAEEDEEKAQRASDRFFAVSRSFTAPIPFTKPESELKEIGRFAEFTTAQTIAKNADLDMTTVDAWLETQESQPPDLPRLQPKPKQ